MMQHSGIATPSCHAPKNCMKTGACISWSCSGACRSLVGCAHLDVVAVHAQYTRSTTAEEWVGLLHHNRRGRACMRTARACRTRRNAPARREGIGACKVPDRESRFSIDTSSFPRNGPLFVGRRLAMSAVQTVPVAQGCP